MPGRHRRVPSEVDVNKNVNWINSPGVWIWYLSLIGLGWLCLSAILSDSGLAWTYIHLLHGAASYWLLHWTKGSFSPEDQGRYGSLTLWEQVDNETYGTATRKFLTAVPLALFVLATHGTDFRKQPLGLNLIVVLVLVIAKLPKMHGEAFKFVVMLPTVPFRVALLILLTFGVAICNSIAIAGCDLDKPLPRWRRRLVELSSQGFCGAQLRTAGFWWPRTHGMHHWEEGKREGAIGVFNHVSYIDAWVCTWAFCAAGLTFEFTQHVPVLGRGIRALQNIYLPTDKSKQTASMVEQLKQRATMPGMPPFVVAPEGTLSHGRCLLTFKTGAFVAGLPVVPILIRYKLTGHNPGWGVINPKWHLLRLLTQFYNHIDVECMPVYHPSAEEKANPALYAANVRKLMAKQLGVPLVDQDRSISQALEKAGIRPSLDGRRVVAPPGVVIDKEGFVDLGPWLQRLQPAKKAQ